MDPKTPLPSHLPATPLPTTTPCHYRGVFPSQEGPLALQSQQQLTLGPPSHLLMSHTMLWPKLGASLRVVRSPGPSLSSPRQCGISQKASYVCPGFQPQKRAQRHHQKGYLISSEMAEDIARS